MKIKSFSLYLAIMLTAYSMNSKAFYPPADVEENTLKRIVNSLAIEIGPRNYDHYLSLNEASKFIQNEFASLGYEITQQKYNVYGKEVENIIVSIGPDNAERLIVGAHYDTFAHQPGADDNASGIAGLIYLAKLLKGQENRLKKRIDLVAYTLEEPPFFRTKKMGSYIHAKSLKDDDINVSAMIVLEMIGYFSDEKDSQNYPIGLLKWFYPDKGNFIGVVSNISSSTLRSRFKKHMSKSNINVRSLAAPSALVGVDFSDHMNYWALGYDALMITDTAFYRNHNYHEITDTPDTLNYQKMAEVVIGVFYGVLNLAIE